MFRIVQIVEQEGFDSLEGTYRRYWLHEGQRVQLHEHLDHGADVCTAEPSLVCVCMPSRCVYDAAAESRACCRLRCDVEHSLASISGNTQMSVTICGLTASGFLRGRADDGSEVELHPDGTSLDMMQGLVRRKL